ncbi:hypothetical protein OC834_006183, partial [Tilletia horrida]
HEHFDDARCHQHHGQHQHFDDDHIRHEHEHESGKLCDLFYLFLDNEHLHHPRHLNHQDSGLNLDKDLQQQQEGVQHEHEHIQAFEHDKDDVVDVAHDDDDKVHVQDVDDDEEADEQ